MKELTAHLHDLAQKCAFEYRYTYSGFLSLGEQSDAASEHFSSPVAFYGGCDGAERKIAIFGDEKDLGYKSEPPITAINIAPKNAKFADKLTHRDFLGAVLSTGLRREAIGDIITDGSEAYVFCLKSAAEYIINEISSVKHTAVAVSLCRDIKKLAAKEPKEQLIICPSMRADAVLCSAYGISRSKCSELFNLRRVFVNDKSVLTPAHFLKEGDFITLRGKGRLLLQKVEGTTQKGRLKLTILVY
mgnify:CR=1 FL=1